MHSIFDLDHTLLDSSHRQLTVADGSLDLAHWIENSVPQKVLADRPLPLIDVYRQFMRNGHTMIICTARVMGTADYELLRKHGLFAKHILSRPLGCKLADHILKDMQLRELAHSMGQSWARFAATAIIFEDNREVLRVMADAGIMGVYAPAYNERAAA